MQYFIGHDYHNSLFFAINTLPQGHSFTALFLACPLKSAIKTVDYTLKPVHGILCHEHVHDMRNYEIFHNIYGIVHGK